MSKPGVGLVFGVGAHGQKSAKVNQSASHDPACSVLKLKGRTKLYTPSYTIFTFFGGRVGVIQSTENVENHRDKRCDEQERCLTERNTSLNKRCNYVFPLHRSRRGCNDGHSSCDFCAALGVQIFQVNSWVKAAVRDATPPTCIQPPEGQSKRSGCGDSTIARRVQHLQTSRGTETSVPYATVLT